MLIDMFFLAKRDIIYRRVIYSIRGTYVVGYVFFYVIIITPAHPTEC